MIFVTVGSQKFQFNRLLKEIDTLLENKEIDEEVFAQIGFSDYIPKHYKYKRFVDRDEFMQMMDKADKVISHGGAGSIMGAVKDGKKVIGVPRLKKFGEHVDDHQLQIIDEFEKMNLIKSVKDMDKLVDALRTIDSCEFKTYKLNTGVIAKSIEEFINKNVSS